MCRPGWWFVLLLLLFPTAASAIQLHWSTGADTLTFASATRCTLVVQADSSEGRLPTGWRLLWLADSSGVNFLAADSLAACQADTARVSTIDPPSTPADSAAHQTTASFCSAGSTAATTACFVLDQPGGSRGRLKVVAIDPTDPDSSHVIESPEVTYNGGVGGTYGATILRAASTHQSAQLQVSVVGSGLSSAHSLRITAPDHLWSVPLGIVQQTDSSLTASAEVPAALPAGLLQAGSAATTFSLATLAADEIATMEASLPDTILFRDPDWFLGWYPKDFAFYYNLVPTSDPLHPWKGLFHLVYIRAKAGASASDSALAHAWSEDLRNWRVDTHAFAPRHDGGWDDQKVWAPSIVQVGNLYYMFYTGVDATNDQRIGYATTSLLDTTNTVWQRQSNWVYSADSTGWADATSEGWDPPQQQFRDPWVMLDPDNPGRYLLFNVGQDKNYGADRRMVVGGARNRSGTMERWEDQGSYRATDYNHTAVTSVESPLVARDSSGTGAWRIYFANAWWDLPGYNSTFFVTESPGFSVADTTLGRWPGRDSLYYYLGNNPSVVAWQASEHLQFGNIHLFAGWNGSGIAITRTYWNGNNFVIGYPDLTAVEGDAPRDGVRFFVADLRPGTPSIRFVLDSLVPITPRLVVYDLAGRRVKTLTDGRALQGRQEIRWDGRDGQGTRVATGMYFARLTGAGAARVLRVPLVR